VTGAGVRAWFARLVRFGLVGGAATLCYATLAWMLDRMGFAPVAASIAAYGAAGVVSYLGHKRITFRSPGAHGVEIPRFALALGLGMGVAAAAPMVLTHALGLAPIASILVVCVAAPALSYLALEHMVFRRRELSRPGT
jgi:putative flippase GtrA